MSNTPQPLDVNQQRLVNIVKAAHQNLALARKTRAAEAQRRLHEKRIEINRLLDNAEEQITLDINHEIVAHESVLDQALIAAYNAGIPITRIATDGFGNRYPGTVMQLINKLRADGLVGSSEDYQRTPVDEPNTVAFPKAIDVESVVGESLIIQSPHFAVNSVPTELVPGSPEFNVQSVRLTMDARDPYFKEIAKNARPGTPYAHATWANLYLHPASGDLMVLESDESGETYWDHPVARWVKDHPFEAKDGFLAAINAAE